MNDGVPRVADTYPPLPNVPVVEPVRIHWTLAIPVALASIFAPTKLGPHLAASGWRSAFLVHVFSIVWFMGMQFAVFFSLQGGGEEALSMYGYWSISDHLLTPLAGTTTLLYSLTNNWRNGLPTLLFVLGTETFFILSALMLTPFIAAGEPRKRLISRAIKLVWWSTITIIPLAYAFPILIALYEKFYISSLPHIVFIGIGLWALWWWHHAMRLGERPPTPAIGAGWNTRPLSCDQCGYDLTYTPLDAACSECNTPVAESLPAYRVDPAFVTPPTDKRWCSRLMTFPRTLRATQFAQRLPVWRNRVAARRFFLGTQLAIFIVGFLLTQAFLLHDNLDDDFYDENADIRWVGPWYIAPVMLPVWLLGVTHTGPGVFGGILAACICTILLNVASVLFTLFGATASYRTGILAYYTSFWLVIPTLLLLLAIHTAMRLDEYHHYFGYFYTEVFGAISWAGIMSGVAFAPAFISLLLGLAQLRAYYRATRYANA